VQDVVAEGAGRAIVGRHGEILEVSRDDLPQPSPLLGDGPVHALAQTFFDLSRFRPHAVGSGLPFEQEAALARFAANEGEAEEVEGLRFAEAASLSVGRREAAKLDQARLVRMQRQREFPKPLAHRVPEAPGVALVLKTDDEVVGISHDDHVARGLALSPALGPEVEDVVQVNVGQQRRDHRPLPRPSVARRHDSVFHDARLQPFLDQAEDALVADPMSDETGEPILVHRVEELLDVGVEYPVHLPRVDPHHERVQRVMRAAPWSESVAESEEILLVDRVQRRRRRPLDDLVLQSGDRERALASIRFGNIDPPAGRRPIRSPMNPRVQVFELAPEAQLVVLPRQSVDARGGVLLQFEERRFERGDVDVVQKRGELLLLLFLCRFPYAIQAV